MTAETLTALGLSEDDAQFVVDRCAIAFEQSECGGFFKTDFATARERKLLKIIRTIAEKGQPQ